MLAVFCGARAGVSTAYADEASAVGREIVRAGAGLVFGGGRVGLMGVLADAVLEEGGIAYGVIGTPEGIDSFEHWSERIKNRNAWCYSILQYGLLRHIAHIATGILHKSKDSNVAISQSGTVDFERKISERIDL